VVPSGPAEQSGLHPTRVRSPFDQSRCGIGNVSSSIVIHQQYPAQVREKQVRCQSCVAAAQSRGTVKHSVLIDPVKHSNRHGDWSTSLAVPQNRSRIAHWYLASAFRCVAVAADVLRLARKMRQRGIRVVSVGLRG